MADELPDAPWATGKTDLPDAPWTQPSPQPSPAPTRGFSDRYLSGFKGVPLVGPVLMTKDIADVFHEGIAATTSAPGQIMGTAPNDYAEIGENIQKQLLAAGASEQEAKREADRLSRTLQRNEGVLGLGMGPMMAVTAPIFGAFRSLVSKPIEQATGFPHEATEQYAQLLAPALGAAKMMPHKVARVRVEPSGEVSAQVIGELPKDADFKAGAAALSSDAAEANLRRTWEEEGIHPAEAVHDAQTDAFLRKLLTELDPEPMDRSELPHPTNSPIEEGTPRAELAKTGDEHIDRVLNNPTLRSVIDNPVIDATHEVPNSWGGSVPIDNPVTYIDREFPRPLTVDGVTFDPAQVAAIHENFEEYVMMKLMKAGWDRDAALRVGYWGYGNPAEHAWYRAHGIDPEHAEAALKPWLDYIANRKANAANIPKDLFRETYPKGDPLEDVSGTIDKPTKEELARARAILDEAEAEGEFRPLGADVAGPVPPTLAQQPPPRPGGLVSALHDTGTRFMDIGRDLQMKTTPMAAGTRESMAMAKDFANRLRRNRWEWSRIDTDIEKRFNPEQRRRMFNAMDEESVAIQAGESTEHQGLATLESDERLMVEYLDAAQQNAWLRAKDLGMVEGDGIPMHAPRMVINITNRKMKGEALALDAIGSNLTVRTPFMRQRKYLTVEETEAAAKAKYGAEAVVARDIRAVALSTDALEDAIAGRTLVNGIREYGKRTGTETVAEGHDPGGWFWIDHPALKTWRKLPDGKFQQVPLYIHPEFEGPLRAVLSQQSGAIYSGLMSLKGKTMSLIMNSPLIHNAVEWGRAIPAMPGKVATFKVYFEGNRAKNNPGIMREAIDAGLVPIGKRFFNQDITSIMEAPDLTPGRSWTAKVARFIPDLFDPARPGVIVGGRGDKVAAAIDKAGDFWHNTLLWDRVGDLQMGLYTNFQADLMAQGVDRLTASRAAAHWANRYAGALPEEAMSAGARKFANFMLFSRSFTLGNLGVMKDMLTGLPRDVIAQIERDGGFAPGAFERAEPGTPGAAVANFAKDMARRKAMMVVGLDIALMYIGNSLLQNAMNVLLGDSTLDKEMRGYAERLLDLLQEKQANPLSLLMPLVQPLPFTAMDTMHDLKRLSATSQNEPGRQDRVWVGHTKDGTGIYARNPVGKIGEEFEGWLTGPLDMIRRKLGTIARPGWQIMSNDAGFGRKIYDPGADTPAKYVKNIAQIAEHLVKSQFPVGQFNAASDLVKGEGDPKLNALQTFGPVGGVTFSKGAPGGPAVGELYAARSQHQYAVHAALPDIRRQIQRGDTEGAQRRMTELGIPPGLQKFYIRTSLDPSSRLSGRTLRDFYYYATPEQQERLERASRGQ